MCAMIEKLRMFSMGKVKGHPPLGALSREAGVVTAAQGGAAVIGDPKTLNSIGKLASARLLRHVAQCGLDAGCVQPVVAKLDAVDGAEKEHRHEVAETLLHNSVSIDVDLGDRRAGCSRDRLQRVAHFVAEVAIGAGEEREVDRMVPHNQSPGRSSASVRRLFAASGC